MRFPGLTERLIRQHAETQSFQKGMGYYKDDSVVSLVQRGNVIQAEILGSQYTPYQAQVIFDAGGVVSACCDCPYDWGGWCKHIVAALLVCVHAPEMVEQKAPLETALADLNREQLQALLLKLVEQNPNLADKLESQIALMQTVGVRAESSAGEPRRARNKLVDAAPFRRQVGDILRSLERMRPSEAYWHVGGMVDQVRQVLDQVQAFVEAGDGSNALVVLEAITDEYVKNWYYLDDSDGYAGEFFGELGPVWTEAILSADLSAVEGKAWANKLTKWQADVEDYGIDEAFGAAQMAALQGWNHPSLQRVLQGEVSNEGEWEDETTWYADDLVITRLNVLKRQKRYQEYLYLAKAERQTAHYVTMLVQLDRIPEAVEYGRKHLNVSRDALALAEALRDQGEMEAALEIAERGLAMLGPRYALAIWLRELAGGLGKSDLALQAAVVAFKEIPALDAYLRAGELAGERGPEIQEDLLARLAQEKLNTSTKVDIYLHEGMLLEAMQVVDTEHPYYDTLERVVDRAIENYPDWVISHCKRQAEKIMDAGTSKYYHHAVKWLEKAGAAYRGSDREIDWKEYLAAQIQKHTKKYKLRPMLEALR